MVYNHSIRVLAKLDRRLSRINTPALPLKYKYEINRLAHKLEQIVAKYKSLEQELKDAQSQISWDYCEPGRRERECILYFRQVSFAMRRANISKEEQDEFYRQATTGDYNHLLITCMEWFNVE